MPINENGKDRFMDLRKFNPSAKQVEQCKKYLRYQPWIISDDCRTGAADHWINLSGIFIMERHHVEAADWIRFAEVNERMRTMYISWINSICDLVGSLKDLTVIDTASNEGQFLYQFLQRGAKRCIGYDLNPEFGIANNLLNNITGMNTEFINQPYDMITHKISGAERGDLVISSAIMCHLSGPLYYLAFLGSITKKALFLFTAVDNAPVLRITYQGARKYYNNAFPICFDDLTFVSRILIDFGLKELGFTRIIELPYQEDWVHRVWYDNFQAIVALRE